MKGLSLEQFKAQLESDSHKKCISQEETIKGLHEQIRLRDEAMLEKLKMINSLQNRCYAFTLGTFCPHCGFRFECNKGGI